MDSAPSPSIPKSTSLLTSLFANISAFVAQYSQPIIIVGTIALIALQICFLAYAVTWLGLGGSDKSTSGDRKAPISLSRRDVKRDGDGGKQSLAKGALTTSGAFESLHITKMSDDELKGLTTTLFAEVRRRNIEVAVSLVT